MLPALSPRLRRTVAWLLGVFALLLLLAWLGLPPLVRAVAQQQLSQQLGRQVTLGAVRFNPFTLTLRIEQLAVAGARAGEAPLLELGAAEVNADLRSVLRGAPVLESLSLQSPRLRLARLGDGRYDIDDLLARWAQRPRSPEPDTGPPRFALYNLSIRDGGIEFDDQPVGRLHRLEALNLGLPVISTLDAAAIAIKVEPRLAFTLDGTPFDTGAQATPFSPERAGRLELRSGEIDLAGWLPYLPADLPLRPTGGSLALDLALEFAAPADAPPKAALSGQLKLQRLALSDAAGTPVLVLPAFSAALLDIQPLKRRVALGEVEFQGLKLELARDSRGQLTLLNALAGTSRQKAPPSPGVHAAGTAASAAGGERAPAAQDPWQFSLARLALKDTQVHWQDASTRPAADLLLELPVLQVDQLGWPLQAARPATRWQAQAAWRDAGAADPAGSARLEGQLTDAGGQALLSVDQASLATGAPYLAQVITPRLSGQLSAELQAEWAGPPGENLPRLSLPKLTLAGVQLTAAPADHAGRARRPGDPASLRARPMASLQQLELQGLAVDLDRRRVSLRSLRLGQPQIDLLRHADGTLNLQQWLAEGPGEAATSGLPQAGVASAPGHTEAAAPSAWQLELAELALTGGQVAWRDEAPAAGSVQLELSSLRLGAKGLQWPAVPSRPLKLQGAAQLGAARADGSVDRGALARLEWNGQLGMAPVAWRGSAKVERFPVHAVAPYFGAQWPVEILRAEAGWTGDLSLALGPQGPSVQASGDARLTDLRLQARRGATAPAAPDDTGAELLAWQSLALDKVKLDLQPGGRPQVDIGQVVLADFFAKLLITEQGRLNLTDLAPPPEGASAGATPAAAGSGATAAPAAPAVQQAQAVAAAASGPPGPVPEAGGWPLDLAVGGVELRGGRVDFTDRFIRPHYSADLSRLEGRLGPFRSGAAEPATLALTGRVAGTALLDVRGSLNPMARPLALDVQARATDLELAPLSPYAAKYAGYAIERGKLSMDVSYRIQPDGQLQARNQIVLNQLTFGDKVESPTATKLPVLLAVSLLKDRHGVIDLDLPIGGSINDPEFSVGGVIVKVILNLLTKALMAPFSLFSGGDSTDLSQVPFVPGTATLAPAALPALDKVAQALQDRPALKMTVTGLSDPQAEAEAIRSAQLEARLQTERRQERVRAGQSAASAPEALGTEERQRLIQRVYADTRLPDKPRNLIGLAKDIPVAEMEARLKAAYPVNADTARELALQRGLAVRDALIAKGLANDRLFLAAPKLRTADAEPAASGASAAAGSAAWAPSAQLSLGTQ